MHETEIQEKLKGHPGWVFQENKLSKEFEFADFTEAVAFVQKIVPVANQMNHHPDLDIRYSKVLVTLTTHDEGGVTEKDFDLAEKIEELKKEA
jgi:4a-hydroxytetrahydrobiopterin dehydratase